MTTYTATITFGSPDQTAVLTTCKPFSDALHALLTQTADTGQANWGTIAAGSTSTFYEIFYLNDSLHSTFPIYVKFGWSSSSSGNPHRITVQVGTGSDGAGNLTGASAAFTIRGFWNSVALDNVARNFWASAGEGYLNIFGGMHGTAGSSSPGGFCLSLERLRDDAGAITGDGVTLVVTGAGPVNPHALILPGSVGGSVTVNTNTPLIMHSFAALRDNLTSLFANNVWPPVTPRGGTYGGNIHYDGANYLATPILPYAGKLYPQMVSCLICDPIFAPVATLSLSVYEEAHTYYVMNANLPMVMPAFVPTVGWLNPPAFTTMLAYPALRYE